MKVIIAAICATESCEYKDVVNVFEREAEIDGVIFCGACQNEIIDITITEA